MKKQFIKLCSIIVCVTFLSWLSSCKSDPPLADNLVAFETSAVGLADTDNETQININLSRAVSTATTLSISLTTDGVTYGEEFTTDPAATANSISVTIPANASTASFKVVRADNIFLDGNESVTFTITNAPTSLVIGEIHDVKLSFSSIVSEGSQLQLQGIAGSEAGSSAANSVFVDFSSNTQTDVLRTSWDLGFYLGDKFRVKINNTTGASGVMIDKTDLNDVSSADVANSSLAIGRGAGTLDLLDDVSGDISSTLIAEISATDSENKVYVLNRIGGSGSTQATDEFVKVRILRNGDGYTLQYAKINETTYKTAQITKDATLNFKYFNFDNGAVTVEPAKASWDIEWTWSMHSYPYQGSVIPYGFSDYVFINNLGGAQVAVVTSADATAAATAYTNFSESDISTLTFSNERNAIGADWRSTSPATGIFYNIFYIVKDANGNYYKLKFVTMGVADAGTRGKPVIEYALVKKGS